MTLTDLRSEHEDAQVQAAASMESALSLERQAGLTALALANEAAEAYRQAAASTEQVLGDQSVSFCGKRCSLALGCLEVLLAVTTILIISIMLGIPL